MHDLYKKSKVKGILCFYSRIDYIKMIIKISLYSGRLIEQEYWHKKKHFSLITRNMKMNHFFKTAIDDRYDIVIESEY